MSGRLRVLLITSAVIAVLFAAATLVARSLPAPNRPVLLLAVAAPYAPVLVMVALVLLALCRRMVLSIVAVAVLVAALAVQIPWYYLGRPADVGEHTDVRILSSNLSKGGAATSSFVELARNGADIVTVSELTPEAVQHFSQFGLDKHFPYSVLHPKPGAAGVGLWSRFPFATTWRKPYTALVVAAQLQIPGVRFGPVVASLHIVSPLALGFAFSDWTGEIERDKRALGDFGRAAGPGAVIVGGDFNSTPDVRQFRDLLTDGYRDAVQQSGAGFGPTFPVSSWHPPLLTIDHVLTRQAAVPSIRTVEVPGSDHRALLATVEVPVDATAS